MNITIKKSLVGVRIEFGGEDWKPCFQHLKALSGKATSYEVDFSDVTVAEDWLHQILQKNEENITAITLQDYSFPKDQYEIFKTDLTKNTTLKHLKIVFPVIQTTPTTNLFEGIANNTSIERLSINLPKTNFSVWQDLGQLFTRNKFIKSLHITEVPLVTETPLEDVAVDLFKSLASNHVLKRLLLFQYNFSARDILALQEGLKHNKAIQFLFISGKIGTTREHELGPLGEALKCNSTITQLFLLAMKVPNEHFEQLVEGLIVNKSIKQLTWDIIVDSLDPFFHYLQTTHSLTTLELKQRNLTIDIERSLFSALAANKSISSLKLMTDIQTDAISSVLKDNITIKTLIIRGKMNGDATRAFETSLKVNKTLTSLDACESTTNYSEVLKHNTTLKELKVPSLKHQELIEVIKYGQFLKTLVVDILTGEINGQDEFDTTLKQTIESNFALTSYWVANTDNTRFNYICNRNYALQKQWYEDTAMNIHVIARSSLYAQLPTEIWTAICSAITYPGLESFKPLAALIFKMYPRS